MGQLARHVHGRQWCAVDAPKLPGILRIGDDHQTGQAALQRRPRVPLARGQEAREDDPLAARQEAAVARVAERLPAQRVQLGAVTPDRDAQAQGDAGGGRGGAGLHEEIAHRGRGEQATGQELAVFAGVGPRGGRRQPFEGETDLGCAASGRPALGIAAGHVQHRLPRGSPCAARRRAG